MKVKADIWCSFTIECDTKADRVKEMYTEIEEEVLNFIRLKAKDKDINTVSVRGLDFTRE